MYTILTSQEFNKLLAEASHQHVTVNETYQRLLVDGFHQALHPDDGGHGSTARLSKVVNQLEHIKGISVPKVQKYIQAHANVTWKQNEDKSRTFEFKGRPSVTIPDYPWYDQPSSSDRATTEVDVAKEVRRILNKLSKENMSAKDNELAKDLKDFAIKHKIQWKHKEHKQAAGKQTKSA